MSHAARPLYFVVSKPTGLRCRWTIPTLALPRQKVALVTGSLAFARLAIQKLQSYLSRPLELVRVARYNRCMLVTFSSNDYLASMDRASQTPLSVNVLSESYCLLCVKVAPEQGISSDGPLKVVGVSTWSQCIGHRSDWAPQYLHERLKLNTLHQHWDEVITPGVLGALRSAKLAWTGPFYFARSMQDILPSEVLNMIVSAVICQY